MYDVLLHDVPLEDCVEPTSVRNLFVAPANLDLAGAEIELVPAFSRELKLRTALASVRDDYDYVLIDCPPSLGLLTVNSLAAATEVLVPIQCEYYALEGLGQLMRNVGLVQKNLNPTLEVSVIVCVMYDARTKLADQVVHEVRIALRRQGVPHGDPPHGAALRGAVVRPADQRVRPDLPGRHRLPGTGEGGQRWWHGAAGWVRDSPSLIPAEVASESSEGSGEAVYLELPVGEIVPNPNQPRQVFDEESLASLTVVGPRARRAPAGPRPARSRRSVRAHRRRAALAGRRRAGLPSIPALVKVLDDTASLEQAVVENLHREDLNPLEEAAAYQQLIEEFHLTHEQVATRVGKSRAAVTNALRLFQLPPAVQKLVAESQLSAGHAKALLGTPDRAYLEHLARRVVAEALTVREVEEAVRSRNELEGRTPSAGERRGSRRPRPSEGDRGLDPSLARARGAARRVPRHPCRDPARAAAGARS